MVRSSLTEGSISKALIKLALPIMGTSFVQMAYNLTDMMWVGRLGSLSVAAVGTAGFFTWFAMALIFISKIGAEVGVAQSVGREDIESVKKYVKSAIQINVVLALIYGSVLILLRNPLIDFFNLGNQDVIDKAKSYLIIIACGMIFSFMNPIFTAIFNGYGNSKIPFAINTVGLITNMILDPLLIFGVGPLPALGVKGAALATVFSQLVVCSLFIYFIKNNRVLFSNLNLFKSIDRVKIKEIMTLGLPVALQNGLFTIFAMFIAKIVAQWGPTPVAVQRVGSQIEAISWMTASGFATALSAFTGQNFGAKKMDRIYKGYFSAILLVSVVGIFATVLFIFGGKQIFALFLSEEEALRLGIVYLRILAYSQLFMCLEITTSGGFNGLGKTIPPSIVGIVFNFLRIPAAIILSSIDSLGLDGVWWSISMSSVFKGIILTTWFVIVLSRQQSKIKDQSLQPLKI
ncbi:MATE family efflux transporter [Alkaliphilus peptidifermentans]|uniref:Probable multidrug resistance protein NorM n=1 Tax=Alkaliphilus peptidifermentans DSM 18978 TaxID=1120976 RepID=A0A1G5J2Q9_9FIRM|nr:MATE family efflux transporter [Alkaliphilus peptidifermentans]SCY82119.1 putative efflux protein, MATE family [Alkaliphilus peptidifermentans DSM 18978]